MPGIDLETVSAWMGSNDAAFYLIKRQLRLGDTWTFDIRKPDVIPDDVSDESLDSLAGAAAFALRRIQVVRHLLSSQGEDEVPRVHRQLLVTYSTDLARFYRSPALHEQIPADELEIIQRARIQTSELMAHATNALAQASNQSA